jgi:hypothetical protein
MLPEMDWSSPPVLPAGHELNFVNRNSKKLTVYKTDQEIPFYCIEPDVWIGHPSLLPNHYTDDMNVYFYVERHGRTSIGELIDNGAYTCISYDQAMMLAANLFSSHLVVKRSFLNTREVNMLYRRDLVIFIGE